MLGKQSRLPAREFGAKRYATVRTPYFLLKMAESPQKKNRIGVVVGVSVHKSAVRRNFWKRQAKATLAGIADAKLDLLAILSPKVNSLTRDQFRKNLSAAAARFGTTKENTTK